MQVFLFWAAALRKGEKEMKVVVKRVVIENEEFALITVAAYVRKFA